MPNERVAELIARKRQLVEELQNDVPNRSLTATERLAKVQEIRSSLDEIIETEEAEAGEITTKPDYGALLELVQAEEDPDVKQALQNEAYRFVAPLTEEEEAVFNYLPADYMEDNPGYNDEGEWVSFVGSYPNPETGEYS